MPAVHIIGAGLAGLAAGVKLAEAGHPVTLHEAAAHAGGRCRSYFDTKLGIPIDNGNHLLLSGNECAMDYIDLVGSRNSFITAEGARFPFLDVHSGESWVVDISKGRFPSWIFLQKRRVPGTAPWDYFRALRLYFAGKNATMADCFPEGGALHERFWKPMTLAAINAPMDEAAAALMIPVLQETFAKGASACRPMIAKAGLSESLVTPGIAFLKAKGGGIRFNHRLTGLEFAGVSAFSLWFGDEKMELQPGDQLIIATPPGITADLLPGTPTPVGSYPIVNAHFLLDQPPPKRPDAPLLGLIGSPAHWLFFRDRIVSVTVSAAKDMAQWSADDIAERLWQDVSLAIGLEKTPLPLVRIVKEKRATFAQTPDELRRRPGPKTMYDNIVLAGDWTDTGLPATIEGAIRSGFRAAEITVRALAG